MLNRITRLCLEQRWLVVIVGIALIIVGSLSLRGLPLDVFPNFAPPQVVIQTEAPGLAPEEVESLVTLPLESSLNGTPGLTDIRSSSNVGLSVVTVVFDWQTDPYRARQLVTERIGQIASTLPQGIGIPALSPLSSPIGDVLKYTLTIAPSKDGTHTSLLDLATTANWTIRNRLLQISGVTRVLVLGGGEREYQVLVKPQALRKYNVTLQQVTDAVKNANVNAPGGFLETPDREYLIRGVGRVRSLADLKSSAVTAHDGVPVLVGDVADVTIGSAVKRGDGSVNGVDGIIIIVTRQPFADTPTVTRAVSQTMGEIEKTLPSDVRVQTTFRQEDFIDKSVDNVVGALRDGSIIVAIVLIFFLGNWRTLVITLAALPLSLIICLLTLKAFGVGLNTMTLGGLAIALGAIIDDAIIYAENIYRRLRENQAKQTKRDVFEIVFAGSAEIRRSVVYATLILIVVMLPIFALSGVEGRIFTPLGIAYIVAIFASLMVAIAVTPALCYLFLANRTLPDDETATVRFAKRLYQPILRFSLRHPLTVAGASLLALGLSLALLPLLGKTFLPEFQERDLVIAVNQLPGATLSSTQTIGKAIERALIAHPEIESAEFRAGRAIGDDDAAGVNYGEMDVRLADHLRDRTAALKLIRDEFAKYPGVAINVGGFIAHRIDEVLSGTRAGIAINIFGPDLDVLRTQAGTVAAALQGIPGLADLQVEPQIPVQQLSVHFDRAQAARYGLTVGALSQTVETALNGSRVSQVLENQRIFDLVVWLAPEARQSPEQIGELLVDTPSGQKIPLSTVATIGFDTGPTTINRQNVSRRIVVSANPAGRDIGSIIKDIRARLASRVHLPQGYDIRLGGQFEAQESAVNELSVYGALALLAVALLLYLSVYSIRATVLILTNLPLALIGGIVAIAASGGVISIASLVGFITLFGVANRNGIILVTTYYQRLARGERLHDAVVQGSLERLSPVLMTALTAALAMVPLMIGGGAGKEILQPLAVVVFGGLFTSTALTLIVLPALFHRFAGENAPQAFYGDTHGSSLTQ